MAFKHLSCQRKSSHTLPSLGEVAQLVVLQREREKSTERERVTKERRKYGNALHHLSVCSKMGASSEWMWKWPESVDRGEICRCPRRRPAGERRRRSKRRLERGRRSEGREGTVNVISTGLWCWLAVSPSSDQWTGSQTVGPVAKWMLGIINYRRRASDWRGERSTNKDESPQCENVVRFLRHSNRW